MTTAGVWGSLCRCAGARRRVPPTRRGGLSVRPRTAWPARTARAAPPDPGRLASGSAPSPSGRGRTQPLARPLAPTPPLLLAQAGCIRAATATDQGGRAGGSVPVPGAGVFRQPRVGGECVGVEAGEGERAVGELAHPEQG